MVLDTLTGGSEFIARDKGRAPQFAGNIVEFAIEQTISVGEGQTTSEASVNIDPAHKSFVIVVNLSHSDFSGGNLPRSRADMLINNNVIGTFILPVDWSSSARWFINEIVPTIKEFWGSANTFKVRITFDSAIGAGLQANMITKCRVIAVPI